jgi:hypothetical protein
MKKNENVGESSMYNKKRNAYTFAIEKFEVKTTFRRPSLDEQTISKGV